MTISVADSVTSVMLALLSLHHKAKFPLGWDSSSVGSILTKPAPKIGGLNTGKRNNVTLKSVLYECTETATTPADF